MALPSDFFSKYEEIIDDSINYDFGVTCRVYYHNNRVACTSCNGQNHNHYGGVGSYLDRKCSYCGGLGYKETQSYDDIKLKIYPKSKKWVDIRSIEIADSLVDIVGFMTDVTKLRKCEYIIINYNNKGNLRTKYELYGELIPHSFHKDRYFQGTLKRIV